VVKVTASGVETLVDGLQRPQGIVIHDGRLYIVDAGAKTFIAFGLNSGMFRIIASGLPVGAPPGVVAKPLRGMPPCSGPQGPFAGIAAGPECALYLSAEGTAASSHCVVTTNSGRERLNKEMRESHALQAVR
jgi:hypothetical protein